MKINGIKAKYGAVIVTIAALSVLACVWLWGYNVGCANSVDSGGDTTTVKAETVTTSKTVNPVASSTRSAGTVTVPVKLTLKGPDEPKNIPDNTIQVFAPSELGGDTLSESNDTALKDTLRAVVPLTQKEYRDSNFTAYVSGFMPKLDSIEVRSKVITYTKTVTKYHTFNVGLTGGLGYGLINKKPDVFIGVGVTWNLFRK